MPWKQAFGLQPKQEKTLNSTFFLEKIEAPISTDEILQKY